MRNQHKIEEKTKGIMWFDRLVNKQTMKCPVAVLMPIKKLPFRYGSFRKRYSKIPNVQNVGRDPLLVEKCWTASSFKAQIC